MNSRLFQSGIAALCVVAWIVAAGCQQNPGVTVVGKVTGGGYVLTPSGGRANFGFNGSSCENPQDPMGRFNFNDMTAPGFPGGVKMNGGLIDVWQCDTPGGCTDSGLTCPYQGYLIAVGYRSTNPMNRGIGVAEACVVDRGEGKNGQGDLIGLRVVDGPFAGYILGNPAGLTVRGNIQSHDCRSK